MTQQAMTPLATYLRQRMQELGLSFRELSRRSSVSHGALGNALSGEVTPRAETLQKLAEALQVDEIYLLRLVGHVQTTPSRLRDPAVEKLADRLNDLPDAQRLALVRALQAILDALVPPPDPYEAAERALLDTFNDPDVAFLERELRSLKRRAPETYERLLADVHAPPDAPPDAAGSRSAAAETS